MTSPALLRLHGDDNVAVALQPLAAGTTAFVAGLGELAIHEPIPQGHKVAVREIPAQAPVIKFGQKIGFAAFTIPAGSWVHTQNVALGKLELDYAIASEIPVDPPPLLGRTFQGYRRADGRAATRNYIGIVSTVNCSATTSKYVAQRFDRELLAQFPNVDGVVPLVHKGGCAFQYGGEDHKLLNRTLAGFARHPNIAAYVIIGLGCETAQASFLVDDNGLIPLYPGTSSAASRSAGPIVMNIQDMGGVAKTVDRAIAIIRDMLPEVNRAQRVPIPLSELILGLNCGGSDGNSGITANPALGVASDLLVAAGGTSVLAETPEIYGGEHLLTRRAATKAVGEKLIERIHWWESYVAKFGGTIDNNPSFGNKAGGLTTIYEKSLGAIAKGGRSALKAVYEYGEPITEKGFVFMDTPGFDPVSVTGLVAGGCHLVVFTTGRGSCLGCKPAPTIKVATNTLLYRKMRDDMDLNAGRIIDEGVSVEAVGQEIFEKIIATASGEQTKSEAQGIGDEEFAPWMYGPVL